jgi:hypothetical protein
VYVFRVVAYDLADAPGIEIASSGFDEIPRVVFYQHLRKPPLTKSLGVFTVEASPFALVALDLSKERRPRGGQRRWGPRPCGEKGGQLGRGFVVRPK